MADNAVATPGYFTGVLDIWAVPMTGVDSAAGAPTYGTPKSIGKSIEVTITPAYREGKMYASNVIVRNKKVVDSYGVKLNLDRVAYEDQQWLLGRGEDADHVQLLGGDTPEHYVAIAFACTLDDGTKEYWWLYKGVFGEPTKSAKTDGDKVEYQTPTMEGTFMRRQFDNLLGATADSADTRIPASVFANWFGAVYEKAAAPSGG